MLRRAPRISLRSADRPSQMIRSTSSRRCEFLGWLQIDRMEAVILPDGRGHEAGLNLCNDPLVINFFKYIINGMIFIRDMTYFSKN
jgi:hypothetical protein